MKLTVREIVITLLSAVALFCIGQYIFPWFSEHAIPKVDNAYFNVTSFESPFKLALKFSLICAAVPVACLLSWKLMPGISQNKKIACVLLMTCGIIIAIFSRQYFAQQELKKLLVPAMDAPANNRIGEALGHINYEYWMTVGLVTGVILCFILFRKKKKKWTK